MERIGLFGGSFDPPHDAHLALAHAALEQLALDRLLWIPTGDPWHKGGSHTPAAQRAAMVALAIEGEPRFALETCEIDRAGPSYTLDTVRELQARCPGNEWFLIVGQDQYAQFASWHRWRELLGLVTLAVAPRDRAAPAPSAELAAVPHRLRLLALARHPHASSGLRGASDAAARAAMVPPAVARSLARPRRYDASPET